MTCAIVPRVPLVRAMAAVHEVVDPGAVLAREHARGRADLDTRARSGRAGSVSLRPFATASIASRTSGAAASIATMPLGRCAVDRADPGADDRLLASRRPPRCRRSRARCRSSPRCGTAGRTVAPCRNPVGAPRGRRACPSSSTTWRARRRGARARVRGVQREPSGSVAYAIGRGVPTRPSLTTKP